MQVYRQNFFTKCLLNPIIEPFRIVVFSIITAMIFIMLISLSQHPVSNNFILSDEEVDSIFSNCSVKDDSARNLNLVIFIPFNENQIDLVIFLRDPLTQKVHEPDANNVLRLCDMYNIPLATNLASAELLIKALDRGDLEWREMYK